jgi:predicted DNA-binding transcriptional regulator AlpA
VPPEGRIGLAPVSGTGLGPYLTPEDLVALFRVSINTVRDWRRLGKLPPAFKIGKLLRWRRDAIEAWALARQESREPLEIPNVRSLEWSRQALQKRSRS